MVSVEPMTAQNLSGLIPQAYEHSSDRAALDVLVQTAGLDLLVSKLYSLGFERFLRVELTGSFLRTTPDSFPDLHHLLTMACARLDLPITPELYIGGHEINAFTAGIERPLIVLSSGAVDSLTSEELLFVIAHEVGHIKSGHVLYYTIAEYLPQIIQILQMLGSATMG